MSLTNSKSHKRCACSLFSVNPAPHRRPILHGTVIITRSTRHIGGNKRVLIIFSTIHYETLSFDDLRQRIMIILLLSRVDKNGPFKAFFK